MTTSSLGDNVPVLPDDWEPAGRAVSIGTNPHANTRASRDAEFSAFMAEAEPALSRMAWLLCGDAHRAQELVQQALVRTYVAWPRAREADPLAYARRVLTNARIDTWRKHRRELLVAPDDVPPGQSPAADQTHADRDLLVRALAQLSPQRRRVVVLRYLMDISEREVAADLDVSLGTVKSTASRGLDQLRALLGDRFVDSRTPPHTSSSTPSSLRPPKEQL